ncbi:MAG: RNA polymerase sigma factor [Phaeodactylibacter sp.]|nr:RNA polymerase sigma factor [Phaeodactylibacter sp.]
MSILDYNAQFGQISELLFGFAMRLTRNREDAKDLMQETAMRAFAHKDSFRPGTNFKAWVSTIMRNSYINRYRKLRTRNEVEQPWDSFIDVVEENSEPAAAPSSMTVKEIFQLVDQLPEVFRVAFMLHYQGYEYKEIAAQFDVPIGTIKSRIFTARQKLKTAIQIRYNTLPTTGQL